MAGFLETPDQLPSATPLGGTENVLIMQGGRARRATTAQIASLAATQGGQAGGSTSSVGLTMPSSLFAVQGSPVTTSGTLVVTTVPQNAGSVLAGPVSGFGNPAFRAIAATDLPIANINQPGAVRPDGSTITVDASGVLTSHQSSTSGGTVTSVGLTVPATMAVSGSPLTTSGTLAISYLPQSANQLMAGPVSGGTPQVPAFRALVAADLPLASNTALGAIQPDNATLTIGVSGLLQAGGSVAAVPNSVMGWTGPGVASALGLGNSLAISGTTLTYKPSMRTVTGVTDTILSNDAQGFVAYTSASPVTITPADLGAGVTVFLQQQGAGQITVGTAAGITRISDKATPSFVSARTGAAITLIGTGSGSVYVIGNTA